MRYPCYTQFASTVSEFSCHFITGYWHQTASVKGAAFLLLGVQWWMTEMELGQRVSNFGQVRSWVSLSDLVF